jgi:hypothetical protein
MAVFDVHVEDDFIRAIAMKIFKSKGISASAMRLKNFKGNVPQFIG